VHVVDGSVSERRFVALYARAGRLTAVLGWNRPRLVMQFRKAIREGASLEDALRRPLL
jgi:3-phenylpropionate/trans-cinnamate dioxygenase ferredoxin reductase subunit